MRGKEAEKILTSLGITEADYYYQFSFGTKPLSEITAAKNFPFSAEQRAVISLCLAVIDRRDKDELRRLLALDRAFQD